DADQQDRARSALARTDWTAGFASARRFVLGPTGDDWLRGGLIAAVGLTAAVGGRRLVRRWRAGPAAAADPAAAVYLRLVALLGRALGMAPRAGETPAEFAAAAGGRLRASPATAGVAGVPQETAAAYYRAKYGRRPGDAVERQRVDDGLAGLEAALAPADRSRPRG